MRRVYPEPNWPQSWRDCHFYDLAEIYGEPDNLGYAHAYAVRRDQALRLVKSVLPRGAHILDAAAAQGNFTLTLAELGYRVTWNDLRAELAEYVQLKHSLGDVTYAPGNVFVLSFAEPFDAVLLTEVIEHVAHPNELLRKLSRLVRKGGYLIMTTPNGAYFKNKLPKFSECADPSIFESGQFQPNADGHIFLLHPEEIPALAKAAGLDVVELALFTNPLTTGHVGTEQLLRILPNAIVDALEGLTQKLPRRFGRKILTQMAVLFRVR